MPAGGDDGSVVRPVAAAEMPAFTACIGTAFSKRLSPVWDDLVLHDFGDGERALGTFEGDRIVGTCGWFPVELTLPGGLLADAAYVVAVSVLPTHRRRGLLKGMMRRQLDDIRAAGLPISLLTASEGGIYGRYGYGAATLRCHYEMDKRVARLAVPAPTGGSVRLVDAAESAEVAPPLWDRARRLQAGEVSLPASYWSDHFEGEERVAVSDRRFFAVYEEAGRVDGWVDYQVVPDPTGSHRRAVEVALLITATLDAYVALAGYLLGIDLTASVRLHHREVDEPLRHLLVDGEHLRVTDCADNLWVRPVDVGAALASRRYAPVGPASVSLSVHDAFCPWNEGRYVLEVGADGAAAVEGPLPAPPDGRADLELGVAALGSALLGGHRWSRLARSGLVVEHTASAAWRADALFSGDHEPFSTITP